MDCMKLGKIFNRRKVTNDMSEKDETEEEVSKATWLHDHDLNTKGINKHLHTLEIALRQGIKESKKELAKMINAKNVCVKR